MGRRREGTATRPPEADTLVGDLSQWEPDLDFRFGARRGMRIVLDLDPDEADLVRRAVRAGDGDFVGFAQRAVVAAARFGVKRDRLQRAAMEGRLPARKLDQGHTAPWLVRPEDVERFLRDSGRGPHRRIAAEA